LFDEPLFQSRGDFVVRMFEDPQEGGFGIFFIDAPFFLSDLPFVDTFEVGVEKVVQGIENRVNGLQGGEGLVPCDAAAADGFADHIAVFLLDIGVVIFVIVAAPGEGDAAGFTPVLEMPVDKFSAVIVVQAIGSGRERRRKCSGEPLPFTFGLCF
jgi:hypothetical protein